MTRTLVLDLFTARARRAIGRWETAIPAGAVAFAWVVLLLQAECSDDHFHGLSTPLVAWSIMTVAMMGPLVAPVAAAVAARAYRPHKLQVWAMILLGYFLVWTAAGAVVLGASTALTLGPLPGAAGFGLTAFWQLSAPKRSALARCHAIPSLPACDPTGAALRFGFRHGTACAITCGPAMAAAHIAGGALPMILVTLLLLAERTSPRPQARSIAIAFGLLGITTALSAPWTEFSPIRVIPTEGVF